MFDSDEYADPDEILGGSQPDPPTKRKRGRKPNPANAGNGGSGKKAGRKRKRAGASGDDDDLDDENGSDMAEELGASPARPKQTRFLDVRLLSSTTRGICVWDRAKCADIVLFYFWYSNKVTTGRRNR
jgi:hypothetical protein